MRAAAAALDIGVVVTAFQAGPFLDLALSGVAHQTLPPRQVVVVDDASTDDTAAVARAWSDRLPIRVIINAVNLGIGGGRAVGVAALDTDYVAVLDADDLWLPEHLAVVSGLLGPRRIVSPLYQVWDDGRGLAGPMGPARRRRRAERAANQLPLLLRENFTVAGQAYSRELYDIAGGYSATRFAEDLELGVRLSVAGGRFVFPDAPTVLYRRHAGAISTGSSATERGMVECLDRIATAVPPAMQRHVDHARRAAEARILLHREREEPARSMPERFRLLEPALRRAPLRQKASAALRIVRPPRRSG